MERVAERLEEIKRDYGEDELPLNKAKVTQAKWKALAKVSMLRKTFEPVFPEKIDVDARMFCRAFPYHVVFNREMQVVHCGVKVSVLKIKAF